MNSLSLKSINCVETEIFLIKSVIFDGKHFTDLWCNLHLAFDWPVAVCHCNFYKKLSVFADVDWQAVVSGHNAFIQ